MRDLRTKTVFGLFAAVVLLLASPKTSLAAETQMLFTPSSGEYSDAFSIDLTINSPEESFNVAQATISVSEHLVITDIILGNCDLTFLKPPSVKDVSFEGVLLGRSATNCIVYTLKVVPVVSGAAEVSIKDGAVKRYGDAVDILSAFSSARFEVIASESAAEVKKAQVVDEPEEGKHTLSLKLFLNNTPLIAAQIELMNIDTKQSVTGTSNEMGSVIFENIAAGLYKISVKKNGITYEDTILNVSGNSPIISLSVNLKAPAADNDSKNLLDNNINKLILSVLLLIVFIQFAQIVRKKRKTLHEAGAR